jgi:YVTN family beta-propeller protein
MNWNLVLKFAVVGAALLFASYSEASQALLVLEKGTQTLAIIDPKTLKILSRVPVGPDPHEVSASADGRRAYVSHYGGEGSAMDTISVIDLQSHHALTPIKLGALRSSHGLDFAGGKLYFTAETNKAIGRYDPLTQSIDWILGIGQDRTHMILVTTDQSHIFTSNVRSSTISIIDQIAIMANFPPALSKVWEVTSVPVGRGSEGFDLSPDGGQLWVANAADSTVTVIDVASKKAVLTFPVPVDNANRLKFTLDGKFVLIAGLGVDRTGNAAGLGNLVVIDVTTHKVIKQLNLGGGSAGIVMEPNGDRAFVAVNRGNKVAAIDLKTFEVRGEIPLSQPDGITWNPGNK